ncbi:MAG: molybdopterin molybdenumtransferase MoeA [Acidobacteria bacterium]|jgi:molybdopterin molybdotransferase|nr:MAG: molybdopterin molybdenumtransferase MoeA [Acidobacteriota bacterium]
MSLTPYDEALKLVLENVSTLGKEKLPLWQALGRFLAEDVASHTDMPLFDNSAMDGYAVRAEDIREVPARLKLIGEMPAGGEGSPKVERGTTVKIFTGAPIPEGADTVVPVELTKEADGYVVVNKSLPMGSNIRVRGEEVKAGDLLLKEGTKIRGYELGLLASLNRVFVEVYRRPKLAILATGDEIKDLGETIEKPSQIRSSNNHTLYGRALELGCDVYHLGLVRDEPRTIEEKLKTVQDYDVFITTGGVSAGERDYIKEIVLSLGFEVLFHKLRIKPAKPVLFARKGRTLFFGLPGNPVSCAIAFDLLVTPALLKMQGYREEFPKLWKAKLVRSFSRRDSERREFLRGRLWFDGELLCDFSPKNQSHMLTSYIGANCYIVVYEDIKELKEGDRVDVFPFSID